MWHELVLCGVGGKTIAEAKANMSYHEAQQWFAYAKRSGGLRHNDRLLATIATQINRLSGGEAEVGDFLPNMRAQHDETVADMGCVMNILAGVA